MNLVEKDGNALEFATKFQNDKDVAKLKHDGNFFLN